MRPRQELAWSVLLLTVTSCGGAARATSGAPSRPPVPRSAEARLGPDQATLYTDGAGATAALLGAVNAAQRTIDAEIYEFDRRDLVEAMLAATRRGVSVRMVGDPTVGGTVTTGHRLAAAGALVSFFPVGPRQIDHVKLLVIDGRVAFFGGVNWGAHSYLNHDFELRLEGPAAARLEHLFSVDMQRSGRPVLVTPAPAAVDGEPALLTSLPADEIGRAVLAVVEGARHSIEVEMFVLTDAATIRALQAAARRGVTVQALFDPGQDLNQAAIALLRPAGVRCRFYRSSGEKLHAKVAVIDGDLLVMGSANWTASGFRHNHELDAVLTNARIAAAAAARMDDDWSAAG